MLHPKKYAAAIHTRKEIERSAFIKCGCEELYDNASPHMIAIARQALDAKERAKHHAICLASNVYLPFIIKQTMLVKT
jgi:dsDNA-specific endonuclease/ATPase MutS2